MSRLPTTSTPGRSPRPPAADHWSSTQRQQRTVGTVGTVVASWAGLEPGNYLGAVSHTSDTLLGYTLVEVDNNP